MGTKEHRADLDPHRPVTMVCVCVCMRIPEHKAGCSNSNKKQQKQATHDLRKNPTSPSKGCRQDCLALFCSELTGAVTDTVHLPVAARCTPGKLCRCPAWEFTLARNRDLTPPTTGGFAGDKESQQLKTTTSYADD